MQHRVLPHSQGCPTCYAMLAAARDDISGSTLRALSRESRTRQVSVERGAEPRARSKIVLQELSTSSRWGTNLGCRRLAQAIYSVGILYSHVTRGSFAVPPAHFSMLTCCRGNGPQTAQGKWVVYDGRFEGARHPGILVQCRCKPTCPLNHWRRKS
jgi:hypothetical protein